MRVRMCRWGASGPASCGILWQNGRMERSDCRQSGGARGAVKETGDSRRMRLGAGSFAFFGLAFARAWLSLVLIDPGFGADAGGFFSVHTAFDLGFVLFDIVLVPGACRLVPLAGKRVPAAFALIGMLAASLTYVVRAEASLPGWVVGGAVLVAGAAYGVYVIINAEVYAGVSILRMILYLSGSQALGTLLASILRGCIGSSLMLALVVLPIAAVGFAWTAYASLGERDRQRPLAGRLLLPWKLIVLTCLFSFVYGLRSTALAAGAGQHSSLSTAIVMGAVFLLAYFLPDRVDVRPLCRAPVLMMASGLLLIPGDWLVGQVVSSYLVSASYTLFGFVASVVVYDIAKRASVPIAPFIAALEATQLFVELGGFASHLMGTMPFAGAASALVSCVVLVAAFALLFSERELAGRWGVRVLEKSSLGDEASPEARLGARCAEFARECGLTPREEEVLRELASGRDTHDIARDLLIAPGTLRAHMRHI